jgi:hypothetical protein
VGPLDISAWVSHHCQQCPLLGQWCCCMHAPGKVHTSHPNIPFTRPGCCKVGSHAIYPPDPDGMVRQTVYEQVNVWECMEVYSMYW